MLPRQMYGTYADIEEDLKYIGDKIMELIPHNEMSIVYVDSEELNPNTGFPIRPATNVLDNNPNTHWHTEWYLFDPPHPHEIQVGLGNEYVVGGFRYLPRQDGTSNGMIKDFRLYVSNDVNNWGTPVATGSFSNTTDLQEVTFTPKSGSYVRLVALSEINGQPWTSMASLDVLFEVPHDPCASVVCPNICVGDDIWSQRCDQNTGLCVLNQLLESNSVQCTIPDICKDVHCPNICVDDDLWSQRCDPNTGLCVLNQLLESNSVQCTISDTVPTDESEIQTYLVIGCMGLVGLAMLMLGTSKQK